MTSALATQIGGGHYKACAIQPMEFSMRNHWDAAAHTALKYVSRYRDKAGKQDLEKGVHCLQLREELISKEPVHLWERMVCFLFNTSDARSLLQQRSAIRMRTVTEISMVGYVVANGYVGLQAVALYKLEAYVHNGGRQALLEAVEAIRDLITQEYPDG